MKCPYEGIAYSKVPGYVPGQGCPVCKGTGTGHINIEDSCPTHPRYQAKRKPRSGCKICWKIYNAKLQCAGDF